MSADYPSMTTAEIRSKFLNFFEERGLKLYPSSSLVPDDPSLLLANAGMNQFKEYYQGKKTMKEIGAISCQKCVRTNDIDCIGEDGRHLSFFEMLGDFSFGGVSKEQACAWAFELITKEFKLPLDRLYFTVFTEDDETHDVWRSLGVAEDHISRLGEDDNFWAAGPTGPCGPCSEIYFDMGEEVGCGSADCKPGCDCDRFLEFWNLVFTQYDRQEDGSMPELPHRNLDTGMGLERMAAIMQHKTANYDGDLMQHLIKLGEEISGKTYDADDYSGASRSLRIIADHSRAVDFMISDGILPGNEGREYVLRRLLRRAVFHGRLLGIEGAFLTKFIDEVNAQMGEAYPELLKNVALVKGIVASEEERFSTTLDNGRVYLDEALAALAEGAVLPGDVALDGFDGQAAELLEQAFVVGENIGRQRGGKGGALLSCGIDLSLQIGSLGAGSLGIGLHALLELGDDGLRASLAVERLLMGDDDVLAGVLDLVQAFGQGGELVFQILDLAVVRAVDVALLGSLDGVIGLNLGGVEIVEFNVQILALGVELGHLGLELHIGLALGSELLELRHIGKFALVAGELQIDLLQLE